MVSSALLVTLVACAATPPFVWYSQVPVASSGATRKDVHPGDTLLVEVREHPELSGQFVVGAAGAYSHPLAGLIFVAGLDTTGAGERIRTSLGRFVEKPQVSVTLLAYSPVNVTVVGEVRTPGAFQVPEGAGVLRALGTAGGLTEFASDDGVYVVRAGLKGERIRFRYSDLVKPVPSAVNFRLQDGDALVVE